LEEYFPRISFSLSVYALRNFIFEMFDEPWKGEDPCSCERNWGLYYVDRTPKPVIDALKK